MFHLEVQLMLSHILDLDELIVRFLGPVIKLLNVDNKIHSLKGHLVIMMRRTSSWRC